MQYRTLGRTGIKVSPYALGAMMFATSIGNPDHDDSVRIIHKALDAGINLVDTADATTASPRRSSARRSRGGATASSWRPRSAGRWATTPTGRAPRGAGS